MGHEIDSVGTWIASHWASLGIGALLGSAFTWFFPSWKELSETFRKKREKKIDSKILEALDDRALWRGQRAMIGGGMAAVKARELVKFLELDLETVAESLERLLLQGRVSRGGETLGDPTPYWWIVPR